MTGMRLGARPGLMAMVALVGRPVVVDAKRKPTVSRGAGDVASELDKSLIEAGYSIPPTRSADIHAGDIYQADFIRFATNADCFDAEPSTGEVEAFQIVRALKMGGSVPVAMASVSGAVEQYVMSTFTEPFEDSVSIFKLKQSLKPECVESLKGLSQSEENFVVVKVLLAVVREEICSKAEMEARILGARLSGGASSSCQKGSEGQVVVGYMKQSLASLLEGTSTAVATSPTPAAVSVPVPVPDIAALAPVAVAYRTQPMAPLLDGGLVADIGDMARMVESNAEAERQSERTILANAARDFAAMEGLLHSPTAEGRVVLETWMKNYGNIEVQRDGHNARLEVPNVDRVKKALIEVGVAYLGERRVDLVESLAEELGRPACPQLKWSAAGTALKVKRLEGLEGDPTTVGTMSVSAVYVGSLRSKGWNNPPLASTTKRGGTTPTTG